MGCSRKDPYSPQRKFLPSGGGGEKTLFLIIVNVLGHPRGVGGLTSYFLRGVFWNDPIYEIYLQEIIKSRNVCCHDSPLYYEISEDNHPPKH
jgi:hypothetical protein